MDVIEAIKKRRSVRAFTNDPVSKEEIIGLIDAARWAPSAGNIQPWEFIVVLDAEKKRSLSIAALNQSFIEEAPVVIVVCANQMQSGRIYGSRGISLYCLQDTAAAIQNMLLASHALGLSSCWVGSFHEEETREVLRLPNAVRPIAIIPIGHAAEIPVKHSRRSLNEIIHYDTFKGREV